MIWNFLVKLFNLKVCSNCASLNLNRGHYIRGWNDLCEQATGADGLRCYDCGKIYWKQTCEEYKANLPSWCRAYC